MTQQTLDEFRTSDKECPTCGRTDFATRQGMKTHHKRIHDESLAGEPVECEWCGETTRKPPSRITQGEGNFCDLDCKSQYMAAEFSGEDSWHWKEEAGVDCSWCGGSYRPHPYLARRDGANLCSTECMSAWRSANYSGEEHPNWKGGDVVTDCDFCGDETEVTRSNFRRYDRNFCDVECYGDWFSDNIHGESHPLWKHGGFDYGEGWSESKREAVRERDGWECQWCAMGQEEHLQRYGMRLSVHHITPARLFDDPSKRNSMDNLETVCKLCHPLIENFTQFAWA